jgi:hypothetical protein
MGQIQDGIEALKTTGDPARLHKAVAKAPSHRSHPNPQGNDNRGPISSTESFDDVTAAWTAGHLTDEQYQQACNAAVGKPNDSSDWKP